MYTRFSHRVHRKISTKRPICSMHVNHESCFASNWIRGSFVVPSMLLPKWLHSRFMAHSIAILLEARLPTSCMPLRCYLPNHASPRCPSQRRHQTGLVTALKTNVSFLVRASTRLGPVPLGFGPHRGGLAAAASIDDSTAVGKESTASPASGEGVPSLGGGTAAAAKVLEPSRVSSGLLTSSSQGDAAQVPAPAPA